MKYTPKQLEKIVHFENSIEWVEERIDELKESIVDNKLAMELAREMLNPAVAAESIKKALARQSEQELTNQLTQRFATRAAPGAAQMPANENRNALAR